MNGSLTLGLPCVEMHCSTCRLSMPQALPGEERYKLAPFATCTFTTACYAHQKLLARTATFQPVRLACFPLAAIALHYQHCTTNIALPTCPQQTSAASNERHGLPTKLQYFSCRLNQSKQMSQFAVLFRVAERGP
jgi:hypothetical protein